MGTSESHHRWLCDLGDLPAVLSHAWHPAWADRHHADVRPTRSWLPALFLRISSLDYSCGPTKSACLSNGMVLVCVHAIWGRLTLTTEVSSTSITALDSTAIATRFRRAIILDQILSECAASGNAPCRWPRRRDAGSA